MRHLRQNYVNWVARLCAPLDGRFPLLQNNIRKERGTKLDETRSRRHEKIRKIAGNVLFFSLLLSTVYAFIRFLLAPEQVPEGATHINLKSDYLLMLVQCLLGILVMSLPSVLTRRWNITIASPIYILYYVFLYCAVFLGEVFEFYETVPHWDTMLHFFSGMMLCALGFILVDMLNRSEKIRLKLSPVFVALFAFCFSLSCGAIWEIYEYTVDCVMGLNMQKYLDPQGIVRIGQTALRDTMKDIIMDAAAALLISVIGLITTRRQKEPARPTN